MEEGNEGKGRIRKIRILAKKKIEMELAREAAVRA